jgi:cytochrome c553
MNQVASVQCDSCHTDKTPDVGHGNPHGLVDSKVLTNTDCTTSCHTIGAGAVETIHSNVCDNCHQAAGGGGALWAGLPTGANDCDNCHGFTAGTPAATATGHHTYTYQGDGVATAGSNGNAMQGYCIDCHKPDVGQGTIARDRTTMVLDMPQGLACNWCHLYWGGGQASEGGCADGYTVVSSKVQVYSLDWDPNANRTGVTDTVNAPAVKTAIASHAVSENTTAPVSDYAACFACHGFDTSKGGGLQVTPFHGYGAAYVNDVTGATQAAPNAKNQSQIYGGPTTSAADQPHTYGRHPGWGNLGGGMATGVNLNKSGGKVAGVYDGDGASPKNIWSDSAAHDSKNSTYSTTFDAPWDSYGSGDFTGTGTVDKDLGTWYPVTAMPTTMPAVPVNLGP